MSSDSALERGRREAGSPGVAPRAGPDGWKLWSAVAAARRRRTEREESAPRLVYRSRASLRFLPAEVGEVAARGDRIELLLAAPGFASPGSALPGSDIERIARIPALADWLDGTLDRYMHAVESAHARSSEAFALASGGGERGPSLDRLPGWSYGAPRRLVEVRARLLGARAGRGFPRCVVPGSAERRRSRGAAAVIHRAAGAECARARERCWRTSSRRAWERRSAACSASVSVCPTRVSKWFSMGWGGTVPPPGRRIR